MIYLSLILAILKKQQANLKLLVLLLMNRSKKSFGLNNETLVPYCQKYSMPLSDSEPIRLGFYINNFIPLLNEAEPCFEEVKNAFDLFLNYPKYLLFNKII
ncbi:hypothetical protein BpHYR1_018748 [Brachionus plicatilis]|uniref:Uncharacterized protein n=1 Tax=Brachionus plicatilis TaxID=10195 RepID=A0A3M7QNY3_BRAPC|nr:hypothetical protein BpHYR1_018748 [Brachionus plicatilis]